MKMKCNSASSQGHFPEAEKDPVIQIASMITEQGQDKPIVRNVMTLNSCAPIVGAEVMSFQREEDLLKVRSHILVWQSH
jgi:DNA polymerase delta subunit 1